MGKSARQIGREFGKTAQEMNKTFHDYGYLEGKPGAWLVTEKGSAYAEEHSHSNGYGGLAARSWETRTWDESVVDALKQDIAERPEPLDEAENVPSKDSSDVVLEDCPSSEDENSGLDNIKAILGLGVLAYGAVEMIRPHMKPMYEDMVKPAVQRIYDNFRKK